jgi:hypothetical protein
MMTLKEQLDFVDKLIEECKKDETLSADEYSKKLISLREVRKSIINLSTIRGLVV